MAFLGRKLRYFQWIGIAVLIAGLGVVGVSDFIGENIAGYTRNGIITGKLDMGWHRVSDDVIMDRMLMTRAHYTLLFRRISQHPENL